jgi:hypothetical protein
MKERDVHFRAFQQQQKDIRRKEMKKGQNMIKSRRRERREKVVKN